MCKASKYLNRIKEIQKEMEADFKKLTEKLTECDREMSRVYHMAETQNFNAAEGFYIAKELQEVTRKRRIIKNEGDKLRSLMQSLNFKGDNIKNANKNLHKLINKHSEYTQNWNVEEIESTVLH